MNVSAAIERERPAAPRRRSRRGILVCLGMFVFGAVVLWGLFQAPRLRSPASPDLPWGRPARQVTVVSLDLGGGAGPIASLAGPVRQLDPDYVLVQNIRFDDVLPLAEALGMARSYHPNLFQRADPRAKDTPGDLILSKHPLYDARPLALNPDPRDPDLHGVESIAALDGVRFVVASGVGATDRSLQAFDAGLKRSGSRPTLLGTGFMPARPGEGEYRGELRPVVPVTRQINPGGPVVSVATLFADTHWEMTDGGTVEAQGANVMILFARLRAGPLSPLDTRPTR
jgi:hypothetical protein